VLRPAAVFLFSTWGGPQRNPLAQSRSKPRRPASRRDPDVYHVPWSLATPPDRKRPPRRRLRHVSIPAGVPRRPGHPGDYAAMGIVQGTPMANAVTSVVRSRSMPSPRGHLRVAHTRTGVTVGGAADAGLDSPSAVSVRACHGSARTGVVSVLGSRWPFSFSFGVLRSTERRRRT